jgi:copper(I)-binding protein
MTHSILLVLAAVVAVPASAQDARSGSVTVSDPWSRATAPRATVGAGFLTIRNGGAQADRLVSVASPRAERVEIHAMSMKNGVMRMRPLANGVIVPSQRATTLAPGGNHLMLMGLKAPLKAGERVPVTLRFARAGTVTTQLVVGGAGGAGPSGSHQGHH